MDIGIAAFDLVASAGGDMDMISLIAKATLVAQIVLVTLILMSIWAVALIIVKGNQFKKAAAQNKEFLNIFWNEKSLETALDKSKGLTKSPIANVFRAGVRELEKLNEGAKDVFKADSHGLENVHRAMVRSSAVELAELEKSIPVLAICASAGPFIGLFGTVWGIMVSFQDIGKSGSASLATVAPGIAEALIATAAGLFVGIPAVVAYNNLGARMKAQSTDIDGFTADFMNIVQRKSHGKN